jgi:PD-(D/E)XK nuclease superfamily
MNDDLESLRSFLNEVEKHITIKEPTLFAVGGRGHYENPASDLLAFFFRPNGEHGLGSLFLSTYLECIGQEPHRFMDVVSVEREVVIDGGRIDLKILGQDWCLIIENKIYHGLSNPLEDYEAHANKSGKGTKIFSILLPDRIATPDLWKPVFYKDYCQKLRERMATKFFDAPFSKWHIFAREFILHMENELYNPPMKPEDAKFVEDNADKFVEAQKLSGQYQEFVREELKRKLEASVSGHTFNVNDVRWGFRCSTPQWRGADIVLLRGKDFKIRAYLYLEDISEPQQSSAMEALNLVLKDLGTDGGRKYCMWDSAVGFDSREKAIAKLCECAKSVNDLIK